MVDPDDFEHARARSRSCSHWKIRFRGGDLSQRPADGERDRRGLAARRRSASLRKKRAVERALARTEVAGDENRRVAAPRRRPAFCKKAAVIDARGICEARLTAWSRRVSSQFNLRFAGSQVQHDARSSVVSKTVVLRQQQPALAADADRAHRVAFGVASAWPKAGLQGRDVVGDLEFLGTVAAPIRSER